jgi:pyruvate/2-oxoacid:ferredoxin oxidoreductase alpha subunit
LENFIHQMQDVWSKMQEYGVIIIKVFQPFDMRLKKFLDEKNKQIEKLIFVEMNYTWQMEELVMNKCLLHDKKWEWKISHYRKYTLYPIFLEEIEKL